MSTQIVPAQPPPGAVQTIERGQVERQEFGSRQLTNQAELAIAAVAAREEALVKAEYIMAERHPRVWLDVRAEMIGHCKRARFAEICRYAKPVGRKRVNGEWIEEVARGFTARFAETLAQEMGNVKPFSHVTYEDDMIRVVRFGVTDLQKNLPRSREVTFAKAVEKRGKKKGADWAPPEGREVIGNPRINTYGDPVWLVKATDDEMRNKVNSEESKTQRDFILRLCPRDILEECEDQIVKTLSAEDKADPTAALKRLLDRFKELSGLMPSDLEQYMGKQCAKFTPADLQELRELGAAIRDGQTTFDAAMKAKYSPAATEDEAAATGSTGAAAGVAETKIAGLEADAAARNAGKAAPSGEGNPPATAERPPAAQGAYTPQTLPDAGAVRIGTEVWYEEGGVRKRIRAVEDEGEAPTWRTVEEEVRPDPPPARPQVIPTFGPARRT